MSTGSTIREAYESHPYPHYVHPLADIARLAAVARILGVEAADPQTARVLDLGCGSGSSLLALAGRLPEGRFKGLDFSAPHIASARELAEEAGLTNIEFHRADLLTWTPEPEERYDYIIAYGVFSWVPDEVKERLLGLCRECLAPRGVACVSYMTLPGCACPDLLRDLLLLRTQGCATPEERITSARLTLDFLDRAYGSVSALPHASHLREEVRRVREKEPHFLLHDELGELRDPCYLLQFAEAAAARGLRYLGESEFHMMLLENLPPQTARELADMRLDRLQTEQFIDCIVNRSFRCSLLTAEEDAPPPADGGSGLDAGALRGLCLRPLLQPEGPVKPGAPEGKFLTKEGDSAILRSIPLISLSHALAARPQAFTPYAEALRGAQKLAGADFTEGEENRLRADLLSLYGRRRLELSAAAFTPPPVPPERPRLSPVNRAFARLRGMAVTPFQETVPVPAERVRLCALLDGSRTLAQLGASGAGMEALLQTLHRAGCLEEG